MYIDRIHFEENYGVAEYVHKHYGAYVSLSEGDSADDAFDLAQKTIRQRFIKDNPHIKWEDVVVEQKKEIITYKEVIKSIPKEDTVIDESFNVVTEINKATTLKELRQNQYLCISDFEKKAYSKKEQALLNNQTIQ